MPHLDVPSFNVFRNIVKKGGSDRSQTAMLF
jgi:hypothetical protein